MLCMDILKELERGCKHTKVSDGAMLRVEPRMASIAKRMAAIEGITLFEWVGIAIWEKMERDRKNISEKVEKSIDNRFNVM